MNPRKSIAMMLVFVLIISIGASALAAGVSPKYVNTSDVQATLSFSGTTANCMANITGLSGTTKISASMTLERKNTNGTYTLLKTWSTESTNSDEFSMSKAYAVTKGYTYRLTVSGNVTRNGTTEPVSAWVENVCG